MDNVTLRLIDVKVRNNAQMFEKRFWAYYSDLKEKDPKSDDVLKSVEKIIDSLHKIAIIEIQKQSFEELEGELKSLYNSLKSDYNFVIDKINSDYQGGTAILEERIPDYPKVLSESLEETKKINYILEKGTTVSDFMKLDGFRNNIERIGIVNAKNKSNRNGRFDKELFLKSCAVYMQLKNDELITKLCSFSNYDSEKIAKVSIRIRQAFYDYFKDNPDLLKID